jgi:hypothetical protein
MKYSYKIKFFLTILFLRMSVSLTAQCPKVEIYLLKWEGKKMTLKWRCNPRPLSDTFYIYRACVSISKTETLIGKTAAAQVYEFADADTRLKTNLSYQYRLQYGHLKTKDNCSVYEEIHGLPVDGDTASIGFVRPLSIFKQKTIVNIKPLTQSIQPNTYLPIQLDIKDFSYDFSSKLTYVIISGDHVFETISEVNGDDFRYAQVYMLAKAFSLKKCRIALVQGEDMIGISPEILQLGMK